MDKYIIMLSNSLSNALRRYLAKERGRRFEDIKKKDVANELFDIILTEIDWNLKYKFGKAASWEFYVLPLEDGERKK
ncbi:MAG: hypothetical protein NWE95_01875 [Candidatus Bathyarchaeota archaeon]|nr:hypothetical protein [Candidatus Bathyarchaeota archaeon]